MAAHPRRVWRGGALAVLLVAPILAAGVILGAGPESPVTAQAPAPPQPPVTPALPPLPGDAPKAPLPAPPELTPLPAAAIPVAPPQPATPADDPDDVVEPVVTAHRFPGRFLHATADRVMFLGAEADETPVVVSRSLDRPRPPLADDEKFRTPVPAGDAQWCVDHVVVAGGREAVAVGPDGKVEWRFALPGKPDARESLVGVVGVDGPRVMVAGQYVPAPEDKDEKPYGRIFWFDRATGRMTDCVTYPGGFGTSRPLADLAGRKLYSFHPGVECFDLGSGRKAWSQPTSGSHPAVCPHGVVLSHPHLGVVTERGPTGVGHGTALTAPAATRDGFLYAGLKGTDGSTPLTAASLGHVPQQLWLRNLPAEVTAAPVVTGASVYVVAGKVLYRFDRKTGATCWRKTLPLTEGEAVGGFTKAGDELWVSGNGFFVRVRGEPEPAKPTPRPAPGG